MFLVDREKVEKEMEKYILRRVQEKKAISIKKACKEISIAYTGWLKILENGRVYSKTLQKLLDAGFSPDIVTGISDNKKSQ